MKYKKKKEKIKNLSQELESIKKNNVESPELKCRVNKTNKQMDSFKNM